MPNACITLIAMSFLVVTGCTTPFSANLLSMDAPQKVSLADVRQHAYSVGLFIPTGLKQYTLTKEMTLLNNKLVYPLGQQTTLAFQKNLPLVFQDVVEVNAINPSQAVKLVIQPSIVDFKANVPYPAYNPYEATIVYRVDVFNRKGQKIFTQTATGQAQTSRGLMSGFEQGKLYAEAAQMAIDKALQQIIDGLSSADELKNVE